MRAAFGKLEEFGPALRRPQSGTLRGSRYRNMKELRSVGGNFRALYAFDPRRRAIVLLGGDKTNDWNGWYERNIPRADKRYEQHLRSLGKEGSWSTRVPRTGERSAGAER
jgi:hypothetical protein